MKDIDDIPRLLRWKEVCKIIPFSRSYVYDLMNKGKFPKGYKLVHGGQAVGWWASDIYNYMISLQEKTLVAPDVTTLDDKSQPEGWQDD
jgi:predicted DNA-binding transcriptional regulator AlpA|tara:strand:- start:97 stop:363 length:267 start_codon:yes stop_codon:yes gene_type:complete